jgi:hypothetical protein
MTDREMLLMSYGAMKAVAVAGGGYGGNLKVIVDMVETHLYPPLPPTEDKVVSFSDDREFTSHRGEL